MPNDLHYTVVDLFSGAGGLELGFEQAGFNILFSTDIDEYCEKVHILNRPNFPFLRTDISELGESVLDDYIKRDVDILVGGPPCQGFSTIGKRVSSDPKKRAEKDPRNVLFREYIRILKHIKPKVFLMENVSGLLTRDKGRIFEDIKRSFNETGYEFDYVILNAADYGVPQIRNRIFFFGNRIGLKIAPPKAAYSELGNTPWNTVGNVITDLSYVEADESINHVPLKHGAINIRRYEMIPEGGRMPEKDLPDDLYRRNFGNTFKRLHRDKPSLTMVPGHNAFPIHPWLNRSLTVREAARIQTFPDDYIFAGPRDKQCMQVGNAVPPLMAKAWADCLKGVLDSYYA
jgi:DNA (cytosine-5)-methyltransferase 1